MVGAIGGHAESVRAALRGIWQRYGCGCAEPLSGNQSRVFFFLVLRAAGLTFVFVQVPTAVVTRATESALQKNRKASAAAAGGGAAVSANKDGNSSGSATPSPEKSYLPAPVGKPKRVRPVSTTDSPSTSLVAGGAAAAVVKPVHHTPLFQHRFCALNNADAAGTCCSCCPSRCHRLGVAASSQEAAAGQLVFRCVRVRYNRACAAALCRRIFR